MPTGRNLQIGRTDDIHWLQREIGTEEIMFGPPPRRPPRRTCRETTSPQSGRFSFEPEPNLNLPPAPPLPALPLRIEDSAKRPDSPMAAPTRRQRPRRCFSRVAQHSIDVADDLTADVLADDEFSFSLTFLIQVWFALAPPGYRPLGIHFPELPGAFDRNCRELDAAMRSGSAGQPVAYAKAGCQPELLLLLTNEILQSGTHAPKKIRPSAESLGIMLALVIAVVEVLDAALRSRDTQRS